MSLFNLKTFTVYPQNAGSYTLGRWVDTAGTSYTITGTSQPASPKEVQTLPEGRRLNSVLRLYTASDLNVLTSTRSPDQVLVDGTRYEVFKKDIRNQGLISHYKYLLTEVV
jgi:hypothetical protein